MLSVITNLILTAMLAITSVRIPVTNEKQDLQNTTVMTAVENKTENSSLNTVSNSTSLQKQESQVTQNKATSKLLDKTESGVKTSDEIKQQMANEKLQAALVGEVDQAEVEEAIAEEESVSNQARQALKLNVSEETDVVAMLSAYSEKVEEEAAYAALPVYTDYRQTFYSVQSGEVKVGYGLSYNDTEIRNIDNVMHFYDDQYQEWLPVVAVNINEVLEVGFNERGVPNYYGTILEITYPSGDAQKAIVLDACGACSRDNRIDLWVYEKDYNHDVKGIEYRVLREGFKDEDEE